MKNNTQNLNVLLLSPYEGHRTAEHLKLLEPLKEKGLVGRIVLFNARLKGYPYPFNVDSIIDREIKGDLPDAFKFSSESHRRYKYYLERILGEEDFDIVIPEGDEDVYVTSKFLSREARYLSPEIVDLFQNKSRTFKFVSSNDVFRTPSYLVLDSDNLEEEVTGIKEFIEENGGKVFAKPVVPRRGGSVGVGEVASFGELRDLISGSPIQGDYLLSEFLFGPEYNQTLVVNASGKIVIQGTYFIGEYSSSRVTCSINDLDEFGANFSRALEVNFSGDSFDWSYNADFLRDGEGNFVLSEINPGRLPARLGVFRNGDFNLLEALILSRFDRNFVYDKIYEVGKVYVQ